MKKKYQKAKFDLLKFEMDVLVTSGGPLGTINFDPDWIDGPTIS